MTQSHGGNIWVLSKQIGRKPEQVIDFSSSVSPISAFNRFILQSEAFNTHITHYPDPEYRELRKIIGNYLHINEESIVVGNGTTELLYLIPSILKRKAALIPSPSFSEYERACRCNNLKVTILLGKKKNNFLVPLEEVGQKAERNQIIFITTPNSPTGSLYNKQDLLKLSNICEEKECLLVVDEVFLDFLPDWDKHTLVQESVQRKNLVVLRSFTKFFAIPGLRLGYLVTNKQLRDTILSSQPPWTVNAVAEHAGIALLKDRELLKSTRELIAKEAQYITKALQDAPGIKLFPTKANFFLLEILIKGLDSAGLSEELMNDGILIRDCSNFKGLSKKFVRFSIRGRNENRLLLQGIKRYVSS